MKLLLLMMDQPEIGTLGILNKYKNKITIFNLTKNMGIRACQKYWT